MSYVPVTVRRWDSSGIDFIMGRDGFEPSTSGLKVPWAPDSFLALCFYWWAALGTETLAEKIQRIAEQAAHRSIP